MRSGYLYLLFSILVFMACEKKEAESQIEIFDLEAFLDGQIQLLFNHKVALEKYTGIGDSTQKVILYHDSAGWAKELSIFRTADIHKPGLRSFYSRDQYESDHGEVTRYDLLDSLDSETIYLMIYREVDDRITKIEASQHTNNPIYNSRRNLMMTFRSGEKFKTMLDSFSVKGFQKMVTQDSVSYYSAGKIILGE